MKRLFFIALIFIISACSEGIKRVEEPENLIPRDKMVNIMQELVKLESHIEATYISVAKYHKVMVNSGDSLLLSFDVTLEEFDQSMEYYGSRQDEMESIYSEALDKLNKELGELQEK